MKTSQIDYTTHFPDLHEKSGCYDRDMESTKETMNQQPVVCWETPAVFLKLPDVPNVWIKRKGVFFKGPNGSFRTDPSPYILMGVYESVDPDTPKSEKVTIFDPENFEPTEYWFRELPNDGGEFSRKYGGSVRERGEQVSGEAKHRKKGNE